MTDKSDLRLCVSVSWVFPSPGEVEGHVQSSIMLRSFEIEVPLVLLNPSEFRQGSGGLNFVRPL